MKKRIRHIFSVLLVLALVLGGLPLSYGKISYAATGIQVSDLPPYPSNGQKYWVVFTEGFRNERLEMTTCDISGYGKYAYIVWDTSLLLRGADAAGKYNQYCLNETGNWEQIGSYQRFTDYAVTVIASNLDIYDAYGNKVISKTEDYGIWNDTDFLKNITAVLPEITEMPKVTATPKPIFPMWVTATPKATLKPQATATPKATEIPRVTIMPEVTEAPYEAEKSEITPEPYGTEEPEITPESYGTEEPEITPEPYGTEEPEITPEPYGTEELEITPEPYGTEEPEITPEPYGTVVPEITPDVSDISKNVEGEDLPEVSPDSGEKESGNPFEEDTKYSDEKKKLPEQGAIVTVGKIKYIVKESAKSRRTVFAYAAKQKNASKIVLPEKIKINGYTFKVTGINKNAFKNMKRLSNVKLGKGLKTIGSSAFENCRKLRNIIIPQNVVSIGANAYAGSGLNYLSVKSKKINMLGLRAFYNTGKKVVVVTSGAKRKQYMRMFISQGRMSRKAIFLTS